MVVGGRPTRALAALACVGSAAWSCPAGPLDVPAGQMLWSAPGGAVGVPVVSGSTVYFLGRHHNLFAVHKETGAVLWQQLMRGAALDTFKFTQGDGLTVAGGAVVAQDSILSAYDLVTGAPRWTYHPPDGYMQPHSLPGSDGETVYVAASRGWVYAIDAVAGTQRWQSRVVTDTPVVLYSAVASGRDVYAEFTVYSSRVNGVPDSGGVVALNAQTGAVKWRFYFPRGSPAEAPRGTEQVVVTGNTVVAPAQGASVYALDRQTGRVIWHSPPPPISPGGVRPVTWFGDRVFAGSDAGFIYALDLEDGRQLWQTPAAYGFAADNATADDKAVYIHSGGSWLVAWDASTGELRWKVGLSTSTGILSAAAVDGDRVFAGGTDRLYAFRR